MTYRCGPSGWKSIQSDTIPSLPRKSLKIYTCVKQRPEKISPREMLLEKSKNKKITKQKESKNGESAKITGNSSEIF